MAGDATRARDLRARAALPGDAADIARVWNEGIEDRVERSIGEAE